MNTATGKKNEFPARNDEFVRYFSQKIRTMCRIYKQLAFVWLSFSLMALLSYFFVSDILHQQLLESADNALSHTEAIIASELAEPETMLKSLATSIRFMLLHGSDLQTVHDYMQSVSRRALVDQRRKLIVGNVYGYFDVFGGLYLHDGKWAPPIDYAPLQTPWYIAAVEAAGEVTATPPYEDTRGRGIILSYARRIFDEAGTPFGVVSLDVPLNRLGKYVAEASSIEGGCAVLLDTDLRVIAHRDASQLGKPFRSMNPELADALEKGEKVYDVEGTDSLGNTSDFFFRRLENGWHLGLAAPVREYYLDANTMAGFLLTLAVLLATTLSIFLLHIAESKERADTRLRSMFEASPLCAIFWDQDVRIIECNQEAINLFGVADKQELGDNFASFSPKYQPCGSLSAEKSLEWTRKAFAEGYCRFEWMHESRYGEPIPAEVTLVRIRYQQEFIIAGYIRDLRELKSTLAQIAAESARFEAMAHWYHSILDAIPFPISVQDAEMQWVFINALHEKLLGKNRDALLGLPCSTWGVSICNTAECGIICAKQGAKQTYFTHDGLSYRVDVEILKDPHGNTTGFVEVVQDVTQFEEMAKRQMEVETVSQAKSAFLAVVSHEIRTPMNAILGITEIQLQSEILAQDTREAFGRIYTAGYTLLGIINDILDLSRMEAGKMELMPGKYHIASLINDTVQLNMVRIGGKPIEFKLQVAEDVPSALFGDELRIKQILNNLLSNAFKYTQEGEVALAVSAVFSDGEGDPDVTLVCRVGDTGVGMSEEQVDRLFDEYSRFYLEANRTIEGIGLGMGITRQLVQMMGGEIYVESETDKGSAFTVWLPQDSIGAPPLGREMAENLRQFKGDLHLTHRTNIVREPMPYGSVLVVDDLETNLYVTKGLLAPYGLAVECVLSGFAAIDKIRAGSEYDIILMDHMMPKMDGVETTKILRSLGYARSIIALTANAVVGQAEMFLENGFDGFLSKPVDLRQLNLVLNRLIRDQQPPEVLEAARRQKGDLLIGNKAQPSGMDPQLAAIFARDAEKTVAVLEAMHSNQYRRDDDMHMFVVNVHAMKSALANVGEAELAVFAHKLEQAGRNKELNVMSAETPVFLDGLRAAVEKIRPREEEDGDDEATDEDRAYLREQLTVMRAACAAYDKKAAKEALAGLRQRTWSRRIRGHIDTIANYLLHSDFEDIVSFAEQTLKTL